MKKLFPFLKPYRLQLTVGPFFKLSEAVLELLIPTLMALLIDNGVNMGNRSYIIKMGILMLVIATFGVIFAFICQYLSLIHISEPTRRTPISYAVFCLKKKKQEKNKKKITTY